MCLDLQKMSEKQDTTSTVDEKSDSKVSPLEKEINRLESIYQSLKEQWFKLYDPMTRSSEDQHSKQIEEICKKLNNTMHDMAAMLNELQKQKHEFICLTKYQIHRLKPETPLLIWSDKDRQPEPMPMQASGRFRITYSEEMIVEVRVLDPHTRTLKDLRDIRLENVCLLPSISK